MKASGSSNSTGYSSSMASSKWSVASAGTSGREVTPRANFCKATPSCPSRSESSGVGNAASARSVRMPQRRSVSKVSGGDARTSTGRGPNLSRSSPAGIKVTPGKPRAACTAASGLAASVMFAASPSSEARFASRRAASSGGPMSRSSPARSSTTVSSAVSSTRGEKASPRSSSAAWADASAAGERCRISTEPIPATVSLGMPSFTPTPCARSFIATTLATGGVPSTIATAREASAGSLRVTAHTGKSGMSSQVAQIDVCIGSPCISQLVDSIGAPSTGTTTTVSPGPASKFDRYRTCPGSPRFENATSASEALGPKLRLHRLDPTLVLGARKRQRSSRDAAPLDHTPLSPDRPAWGIPPSGGHRQSVMLCSASRLPVPVPLGARRAHPSTRRPARS